MSTFEKIIAPLVVDKIIPTDLTVIAGFVDSYTYDPDKPSGEMEFYLVYDDSIRNEYSISRARRFALSMNVKRTYTKYVNSKLYLVYSFWVRPEVKKLYNGILTLNTIQKATVLQFWGPFDKDVNTVMGNTVVTLDVTHTMPLEDYQESFRDKSGIIIKGRQSKDCSPFYFVLILTYPLNRLNQRSIM